MKHLFSVVFAMLLFSTCSFGQIVKIQEEGVNELTINKSSTESLSLDLTFNEFSYMSVNTDIGVYTEIGAQGYTHTQVVGLPKLPVLRRLIEVPHGASLSVKVISMETEEIILSDKGIENMIIPAQPPVAKSNTTPQPLVLDSEAYEQSKYYSNEPATIEEVGFMRGTRMARIDLNPISYNPVTGTVRVITSMEIEVVFSNGDMALTMAEKARTNSPYFHYMDRFLMNSDKFDAKDEITQYPVKYVIVADPMFQIPLTQFITWKRQKGFNVIEAYTSDPNVGNTTSSIKAYLKDLYDSGSAWDPAPSFVLFVGDVEQVPNFNEGAHVTDLYYCEYTGDDIPEVYYGRFSATTTAHVEAMVQKTISYEKYQMPDPSYLDECVMVSGADASHAPTWGNGQISYGTNNYFNEAHGLTSHTYFYPESSSHAADVIQHVSDGVCYANYTAHGDWNGWADPSFKNTDVAGLQNENKYCLMVGNCCLSNKFNVAECFGEALLRAENKGALGYIGGSNSTYWDEDFYWGVGVGTISPSPTYDATDLGAYDKTFHDHGEPYTDWYTTQGQMVYAGNMAVEQGSPGNSTYYWEIYHLMGDPSVSIYFSQPMPSSTSYAEIMPMGAETFDVQTEPYSLVAISYDGELMGTAQAGPSGVAVVHLTPITTPGEADIVVTGQNRRPFFGTITIAGAPGLPVNIFPVDGQSKTSIFSGLTWDDGFGGDPENYEIFFGTDNPPTNIINGLAVADTFYVLPEALDFETTYYWQVKAINEYGTVSGNVWSFTTKAAPSENFETGDFSAQPWYFEGDEDWIIDNSTSRHGTYSARSGNIADDQFSSIKIDINSSSFSAIGFWSKVSCENESDRLEFYIDGVFKKMWYGEKEWSYVEYFTGPGPHTFEWKYLKNESGALGSDCAWLDFVYLPINDETTCNAGSDAEICQGLSHQLNGSAFNYQVINWITSGDGSFSDNAILDPVYTPGQSDIEAGMVTLSLSVTSGTNQISDNMDLIINPLPAVAQIPVGPEMVDLFYTTSTIYDVPIIANATEYSWTITPESAGTISSIDNSCTVAWAEDFRGEAQLSVMGMNNCGDGEISPALVVLVDNTVGLGDMAIDPQFSIQPNPSTGDFIIRINTNGTAVVALSITDIVGNTVFYTSVKEQYTEIRKTDLPAGVYMVHLTSSDSREMKKLVISK